MLELTIIGGTVCIVTYLVVNGYLSHSAISTINNNFNRHCLIHLWFCAANSQFTTFQKLLTYLPRSLRVST